MSWKSFPVKAELFHADMTKLKVAFHNFANARVKSYLTENAVFIRYKTSMLTLCE